jgi:DNA repair protein RAD5
MSYGEVDERPVKKRRFFVDDEPVIDSSSRKESSLTDEVNALPEIHQEDADSAEGGFFDADSFTAIVGSEIPPNALRELQQKCGSDIQKGKVPFTRDH